MPTFDVVCSRKSKNRPNNCVSTKPYCYLSVCCHMQHVVWKSESLHVVIYVVWQLYGNSDGEIRKMTSLVWVFLLCKEPHLANCSVVSLKYCWNLSPSPCGCLTRCWDAPCSSLFKILWTHQWVGFFFAVFFLHIKLLVIAITIKSLIVFHFSKVNVATGVIFAWRSATKWLKIA